MNRSWTAASRYNAKRNTGSRWASVKSKAASRAPSSAPEPGIKQSEAPKLHVLAYNLGNFMRTLAMPKAAEPWPLTSLREKLIKIGANVVSHGRYVTFLLAEVAVSRQMFADILSLIARLRAPPAPA